MGQTEATQDTSITSVKDLLLITTLHSADHTALSRAQVKLITV